MALQRVPIDAIPDLSENQVLVYADWPGRSPQEVEDQITYRLSVTLQGLAGVKVVRATSMFGFSFLIVLFTLFFGFSLVFFLWGLSWWISHFPIDVVFLLL